MLQKYIPTPKREYIYNIVSKTSGFTPYGIGDRDTASEEILNAYDSIVKGESELHNFMYARKGYTTSVYPIKDGGNVVAIVGVVKNMELLNKAKTNYIVQVLLIEAQKNPCKHYVFKGFSLSKTKNNFKKNIIFSLHCFARLQISTE